MSFFDALDAIQSPYGPLAKDNWALSKGVFTLNNRQLVFFHENAKGENRTYRTAIDQTTDAGARRLAIYEYPYVDGQSVKDLGRKGETFTFNIKFFGDNYQYLFKKFVDICVNQSGIGKLIHPTYAPIRGAISCRFQSYEFIHRYDEYNTITIRATFIEDNTGDITTKMSAFLVSSDSLLRSALNLVGQLEFAISSIIQTISNLAQLPASIAKGFIDRLHAIIGDLKNISISKLLAMLAATFSHDKQTQLLLAQAAQTSGGVPALSSGSTTQQNGTISTVAPVFQVGSTPDVQTFLNTYLANFVNANQATVQELVYLANVLRQMISAEIAAIEATFGNDGADAVLNYRVLSNLVQETVQGCISISQSRVKIITIDKPKSLRLIAQENGLTVDQQNDIELLNPQISSVNYVLPGTQLAIPVG